MNGQQRNSALPGADHILRHALIFSLVSGPDVRYHEIPSVYDAHAPRVLQLQKTEVLFPDKTRLGVSLRGSALQQSGFSGGHAGVLGLLPEVVPQNWTKKMDKKGGQSLEIIQREKLFLFCARGVERRHQNKKKKIVFISRDGLDTDDRHIFIIIFYFPAEQFASVFHSRMQINGENHFVYINILFLLSLLISSKMTGNYLFCFLAHLEKQKTNQT